MVSQILFLKEHKGPESGKALKEMIASALLKDYGISFESLMKRLTLVTDCAANMPYIVEASTSSRKIPFTEKLVGCICHQLNTVIKNFMMEDSRSGGIFSKDVARVKVIVGVIKHANVNNTLGKGYALLQEVETRFDTTFDVVKRFLKSSQKVVQLLAEKDHGDATKAFAELSKFTAPNGSFSFPTLEALVVVFESIRDAQNALETSDRPTMHFVLPRLEHIIKVLHQASNGIFGGTNSRDDEIVRTFTALTMQHVTKIETQDLWICGAVIHPYLRSLSFVVDNERKAMFKQKAVERLTCMIAEFKGREPDSNPTTTSAVWQEENRRDRLFTTGAGGTDFNLYELLDCPEQRSHAIYTDETKSISSQFYHPWRLKTFARTPWVFRDSGSESSLHSQISQE